MVVDRVLDPVVLEVEVLLEVLEELAEVPLLLLLVVLPVPPLVSSVMPSMLPEPTCIFLEVCCALDLLHACISGMTINFPR